MGHPPRAWPHGGCLVEGRGPGPAGPPTPAPGALSSPLSPRFIGLALLCLAAERARANTPGSGLQSDRRALLKRPSHRATRALTLRSARQATFGQTMRKACHMCSGCGFRPKPSARGGPKPLEAAAAPTQLIRATPRPPAPGCGSPSPREGIRRLRLCSIFTFHLLFPGISKMRRLCGERRPALFARPWRPAALCPHTTHETNAQSGRRAKLRNGRARQRRARPLPPAPHRLLTTPQQTPGLHRRPS